MKGTTKTELEIWRLEDIVEDAMRTTKRELFELFAEGRLKSPRAVRAAFAKELDRLAVDFEEA